MTTNQTFYETLSAKALPWVFLLLILVIALFVPIVRSIFAVKVMVSLFLLLIVLCLIKSVFIRRPVITLQNDGIVLRGVRPGIWKLFQRWVTERIDDANVTLIRIGYLREKHFNGLISWPPGEPSKGAMFQMFLWIKYNSHGHEENLYYPHLKNVADFMDLIKTLESRYGSKVEKRL
jgi:hypothetical protein